MPNKALALSSNTAAHLLLDAQGLLDDPERSASPAAVQKLIERMGFVQVDTINVVERAHHITLFSRMHNYRHDMLANLIERKRMLFEHWTHDASVIPMRLFPHWKHRFDRYRQRVRHNGWWTQRLGDDHERTLAMVRERIQNEGPLQSRDFEHDRANHPLPEDGWWGWKPAKAALEHLWRCGELTIIRRINFQKVYDLTERALPEQHCEPKPTDEAHIAWACRSALERLGVANATEIAAFWRAIEIADARRWCGDALRTGELIEVNIENVQGGKPRAAFALAEMEKTLRRAARRGRREIKRDDRNDAGGEPMRVLSPFDPVIRDRQRCLRLFGFDYRFEAFTPEPKRTFGYYVLPLLQGERLVGRVNPKFHRDRGELVIDGVWWEKCVKPTKQRAIALNVALERFAKFIGAERVRIAMR